MFSKSYQYIRAFSLDVVAGAAISARWVGNYFEVNVPFEAILALSVTVWLIYTLDHLLDARKIEPKKALLRHLLHYKNAPILFAMVVMMTIVLIFTVQYLSTQLFWYGMLLGSFVIAYLFFVHYVRKKPYWGKEWFIAVVYATGICLPTIAHMQSIPETLYYFWAMFFLLASVNLLIFNMFEYRADVNFGFSSFATVKGHDYTRRVILLLLALFVILWSVSFIFIKDPNFLDYQAMFIFMGSVLSMVLSKETVLKEEEWYRVIGDIIFVLPVLELLFVD